MIDKSSFPKVQCKALFKSDGEEAARTLAKTLKIPDTKINRWVREWGNLKPAEPKASNDVKAPSRKDNLGFHPEFKYASRTQANDKLIKICKSAGLRLHAFHVLEDDGRFAVVPATYKPNGPEPMFNVGDIVYDVIIANTKAKVLDAGPQQTLVRYLKDRPFRPREEAVINRFLIKLPDEVVKPKKEKRK